MPKKTAETSQPEPSQPQEQQNPEHEAAATSPRTHVADDVTNQPTGEVEQSGPVTYQADHVPDDGVPVMGSKRVAAPAAEKPAPAKADPETA